MTLESDCHTNSIIWIELVESFWLNENVEHVVIEKIPHRMVLLLSGTCMVHVFKDSLPALASVTVSVLAPSATSHNQHCEAGAIVWVKLLYRKIGFSYTFLIVFTRIVRSFKRSIYWFFLIGLQLVKMLLFQKQSVPVGDILLRLHLQPLKR